MNVQIGDKMACRKNSVALFRVGGSNVVVVVICEQ